jgi:hypothetical protein
MNKTYKVRWSEYERKLDQCDELTKDFEMYEHSRNYPRDRELVNYFWKKGIRFRSFYFMNPIFLALSVGTFFGIFLSNLMMVFTWLESPLKNVVPFLYVGWALGLVFAVGIWIEARLKKLPRWKDL